MKCLRLLELALAAALAATWHLPWMTLFGTDVPGLALQEKLEGPHRLLSIFTADSRISLNYALAGWVWLIPTTALATGTGSALGLLSRAWTKVSLAHAWLSLLTGAFALAAGLYLRGELEDMPFQKLGPGARLAMAAGAALAVLAILRIMAPRRS